MMKKFKIYLLCLFALTIADTTIDQDNNIYYLLPGPNLASFNILPDDTNVESIFSTIENNLISIINEGEISFYNGEEWVGSLSELNNESGYWLIVSEITLLDIEGNTYDPPLYFLNSGANFISYPYSVTQPILEALPFYMHDKLIGIIGQNEAALFSNGEVWGSLETFQPNKGYWFLLSEPVPFEYNAPSILATTINNQNINNEISADYNQSTYQSIFFIDQVFMNDALMDNYEISIFCNNVLVGQRFWEEEMTDLIVMGNDGFDFTNNYCIENNEINIQININNEMKDMYILGNSYWSNNQFSTIILSDYQLGNINFDNSINITDIVIIVDYLINNSPMTEHQLLLSDVNQNLEINVTDVIVLLDDIID